MKILKKVISFMFSRLVLVALMIAVQLSLIVFVIIYFSQNAFYTYMLFNLLSFLVVIIIVSNNENPSFKISWIIAILILPLTGGVFYLLFGNKRMPKKLRKHMLSSLEDTHKHMPPNELSEQELLPNAPELAMQSQYIYNMAGYPLWNDTDAEYFPVGEAMFDRMVTEMKKAERFIFLEYFIVQDGLMWGTIFGILKDKIREGVEVRMMYDDLGCINTLPDGYDRVIRGAGIQLCVFNPFRPRVNAILNYRDHRKVCVIDGITAFCGGINLADEYINQYPRYGHWKDTGIMLKGKAVWSFTFMFLQQWKFNTGEMIDFHQYHQTDSHKSGDGLVQVFDDSPLDKFNVTETTYHNIISRATKYVYITTPYLVIDYEMETVLCSAAQSGVDVRIITPYVYDKWYVHTLTRSHYERLIKAGVKIYEYTPGFMHGKMFVSDDKICLVGTCNMDFRSFYLHFECSVAFYNSHIIHNVKQDMIECQNVSRQITLEEAQKVFWGIRILRSVLKIFAPMM